MSYKVYVEGELPALKKARRRLRQYGLSQTRENRYSGKVTTKAAANRLKNFCWRNKLRFAFDNSYGYRDPKCRYRFIRNNPPVNGKYQCVYCGRKIAKDKMEVDHLYPVAKVSRSLKLQKKLASKGIKDINALQNLVPACAKCNKRKSDKMGGWIIKGKLGRHAAVWRFRKMIRFQMLLFLLVISYGVYTGELVPYLGKLWTMLENILYQLAVMLPKT